MKSHDLLPENNGEYFTRLYVYVIFYLHLKPINLALRTSPSKASMRRRARPAGVVDDHFLLTIHSGMKVIIKHFVLLWQ